MQNLIDYENSVLGVVGAIRDNPTKRHFVYCPGSLDRAMLLGLVLCKTLGRKCAVPVANPPAIPTGEVHQVTFKVGLFSPEYDTVLSNSPHMFMTGWKFPEENAMIHSTVVLNEREQGQLVSRLRSA